MFERLWRSPLGRARQAARSQRWTEAAAAYRRHLARRPQDAMAWVQLGHALKELDDLDGAAQAYGGAVRARPALADAWVHLAHVERRLGHAEAAVSALGDGLSAVPGDERLIAEMLALGARERLPVAAQTLLEQREGSYALSRYAAFRAAHSTPTLQDHAPEWQMAAADVLAVIDARAASPELVAATRETLAGMACFVMNDGSASIAEALARIGAAAVSHLLLVEGGTRLDPAARDWLVAAATRTGASATFCDHDHWEPDGRSILLRDPCFQPMRDPLRFACADVLPPCVLVTREAAQATADLDGLFERRLALPGSSAHVPLLLASRSTCAVSATGSVSRPDKAAPSSGDRLLPIQVVIQTRDAPELLERCVDTLRATAALPDLLDVVVMDNRSVLDRTAELLAGWEARGIVRRIAHDEPFNWARANNLAAALGDAPLLLFLNNDVEMETPAWDTALRDHLADGTIGAIGARLLYPDRRIQHAGVIFGMETDRGEPGGPVHEGVGRGMPSDDGGPADDGPDRRWARQRLAAAVTGAWLATTRALFDAAGGFEERLPVAFNDIDFCLRCRAVGLPVAQASDIVAIHRESATRGTAPSPEQQDRERAEWAWMRERWGEALELDPAFNPHWVRSGRPFDGIALPSPEAVDRWIFASARPRPWAIDDSRAAHS